MRNIIFLFLIVNIFTSCRDYDPDSMGIEINNKTNDTIFAKIKHVKEKESDSNRYTIKSNEYYYYFMMGIESSTPSKEVDYIIIQDAAGVEKLNLSNGELDNRLIYLGKNKEALSFLLEITQDDIQ